MFFYFCNLIYVKDNASVRLLSIVRKHADSDDLENLGVNNLRNKAC
jgi:hypothetical protein